MSNAGRVKTIGGAKRQHLEDSFFLRSDHREGTQTHDHSHRNNASQGGEAHTLGHTQKKRHCFFVVEARCDVRAPSQTGTSGSAKTGPAGVARPRPSWGGGFRTRRWPAGAAACASRRHRPTKPGAQCACRRSTTRCHASLQPTRLRRPHHASRCRRSRCGAAAPQPPAAPRPPPAPAAPPCVPHAARASRGARRRCHRWPRTCTAPSSTCAPG